MELTKYLLDTHTFLWFVSGNKELSSKALHILENQENEILLSMASLWEISIKSAIGKLKIQGNFDSVIDDVLKSNIQILPIDFKHIVINHNLEHFHKDPFDRIIVAQSISENIDVVSKDSIFDIYLKPYSIKRIW